MGSCCEYNCVRKHCTSPSLHPKIGAGFPDLWPGDGRRAAYWVCWPSIPGIGSTIRSIPTGPACSKSESRPGAEYPEVVVAFGTSRIGGGFDAKQIEPLIQEGMQHRGVAINFGFAGIGPLAEHIYLHRCSTKAFIPIWSSSKRMY